MNKKYTHIFFDLDNTLWDFNKNSRLAIHETFLQFKLDQQGIDFDLFFEVYTRHNDGLWSLYRKKEIHKNELKRQRFQKTLDDIGVVGVDAMEMNNHYLEMMPQQTILHEGALEVLSLLKSLNYKLFIITNGFSEVQHRKLKSSGLEPFFERVFISEEVKCPKPQREIFEYAITSTNARKSKSVMIGDDFEVDVKGALNVGISGIYFNPKKLDGNNDNEERSHDDTFVVIHKLTDLLKVL
ncbi:YjjG family noncanonical pyrimidine nucleotidase [Maribellus sp. YY47]|uniref:YjjG family noncanonical pyrimidine nucleotidase n=1 Tax=Maribellus sp. YY47 TaxID=2929486 RepID=UPI002001A2F6|nr:YjjG family noncanonical pyrimidine nucleotidase [Maribellus sp. YY47]MCK3684664.1 YjjG family noncanonical pyrimidine nucleotidase [Maribellus sp. YY47]